MNETTPYHRACSVFLTILDLPEDERAAAIDSACGPDSELRSEVLRLVSGDKAAQEHNFIGSSAFLDAVDLVGYRIPKTGTMVGRFRIVEPIGSGGMGLIMKAQDDRLDRTVALKLLPAASTLSRESLLRLQREARAASFISHPNIVSVFDADFEHGWPHIAMEFVEGRTLRQVMANGPVDERTVLNIASQVASALTSAHKAGMVHRDIKPENIMVREDGLVKVLDFGLAKIRQSLTQSEPRSEFDTRPGIVMGTTQYISPEQILGENVGAGSDLFSLGVVLYELATGVRPFDRPTEGGVLNAILSQVPKPPRLLNRHISRECDALIIRLLQKEPRLRFSSAEELLVCCKQIGEKRAGWRLFLAPHLQFRWKTLWIGVAIATITTATLVYVHSHDHPLKPGDHLRVDRLTTSGRAFNPALSQDGRYVAYLSSQSGENTIHVLQLATKAEIKALDAGPGEISDVAFSPDENYLYFTRLKAPEPVDGLFRVPLFGGQPQLVLGGAHSALAISHDGRFVAVVDKDKSLTKESLLILDLSNGKSRLIQARSGVEYFDNVLAWSPDNRYIATAIGVGNPVGFAVIDRETGVLRAIGTRSYVNVMGLVWFPDGKHWLASVDRGNSLSQLVLVDYPSGQTRQITNGMDSYQGLSLSASGDMLLACVRRRSFHLSVATWAGKAIGQPAVIPTGEEGVVEGGGGLEWVGNDRLLDSAPDSEGWNLRLLTMTGQIQPLTRGPYYRAEMTVCPDMRTLVYKSDQSENLNLWKTDLLTGETKPVTRGPSVDSSPYCAADSQSVMFVSNRDNKISLWRTALDGSLPKALYRLPSEDYALSPDRQKIAIFDRLWWMQPPSLALLDAETGVPLSKLALPSDGHPGGARLRWTPDGTGVLFLLEQNGATNIWRQPVNGGPARQVTHFHSGLVKEFSFSPDGTKLSFSQGSDNTDIVQLRDFVTRN
jgi:serine/threonine protein kinase